MAGGPVAARRSPATPAERRDAIRPAVAEAGTDALLVTHLPDIRYLTGFSGSAGVAIVGADGADRLVTSFLYRTQVRDEVDPTVAIEIADGPLLHAAAGRLADGGAARVGFEPARMSVADWEGWRSRGPELVPLAGEVARLRVVKAPAERAAIARAAALAETALETALEAIRPGVSERELASRLDRAIVAGGGQGPAFETIVLFGERTALPHGRPGTRALARGEIVLLDFGARLDGYVSDATRTVALGNPPAELARIYRLVLEAQRRAIAGLSEGVEARAADELAREVLAAAGYGEAFGHSLGHGVGLEVHEPPRLATASEDVLEAGMVVTVEPGVYIEGLGGVRIEDVVAIEPDFAETLTTDPANEILVL